MNFKNRLLGLGALLLSATPAFAAEDIIAADAFPGTFSGNVALTTEYIFRGISQSDDRGAIQGGLTYAYDFGSVVGSLGIWGSNVNFADASVELDYTATLSGKVREIAWNLGYIYYNYPGSNSNVALDQDFNGRHSGCDREFLLSRDRFGRASRGSERRASARHPPWFC